jgi:hypothetical protein
MHLMPDDDFEPMPRQIALQVQRLGTVRPIQGELRQPGKQPLVKEFVALDIADCERLIEQHTRAARNGISRYRTNRKAVTAQTTAEHIVKARAFQTRREELLSLRSSTAPSDTV